VHSGIPGRSGVASRRRCYSRGRVTHRPGRLPPPPPPPLAGALLSLVEGTRRSYVLALALEMTEGRGLSPPTRGSGRPRPRARQHWPATTVRERREDRDRITEPLSSEFLRLCCPPYSSRTSFPLRRFLLHLLRRRVRGTSRSQPLWLTCPRKDGSLQAEN